MLIESRATRAASYRTARPANPIARQASSKSDRPPNKGMKQTKPAQAMELRSLSPVLGGPARAGRKGWTSSSQSGHASKLAREAMAS